MRRIVAIAALLAASGLVLTDDSWQPESWAMKDGTVRAILAGWELTHLPDSEAGMLMVGKSKSPVARLRITRTR